jgi:hypothetical protein
MEFPGSDPGRAAARLNGDRLTLENAVLAVTWQVGENRFQLTEVADRIAARELRPPAAEAFWIEMASGEKIPASRLRLVEPPALVRIELEEGSVQLARRFGGWQATARLLSPDGRFSVLWSATIRDGSNYVRQQLVLQAESGTLDPAAVGLFDLDAPQAEVAGAVSGSPVVSGNLFFACEHPMADNRADGGRIACVSRCREPLPVGESWTRTSVIGVAPAGQLRRAFLYYVERQRSRPYRLFLHYNSWWDIAWPGRTMSEEECLDVIRIFRRELVEKRGAAVDSFVFDDGWDDPKSLWRFHAGFPQGFAPLAAAAREAQSSIGVWLSPWGGYGQAKADRLAYGRTQGFETNDKGFSLAGPTYYGRFAEVCKEMISNYGVNYFKFDGIARGTNSDGAGDEYAADVESLLRLAGDLRRLRPDVYLSITTGTWPSPYWLWYGDSVWRNGHDLGFHGAGTMRQQSITYRDMLTRRMIVDRAPLYPLNSLMIVSVCYAQLGTAAKEQYDAGDLADEIRMAFAGGTQLLELYVTPQMVPPEGWDVLADSARWSRENADVLVDAHLIGGDPGEGEPYGYASWSPRKGIVALRNPGDAARTITFRLTAALELPPNAAETYRLTSRWARPGRDVARRLSSDEPCTIELEPFEVLVLEAQAE